jgi:uncharacterized protein YebE (UPF0316 family)
VVVGLIVVEIEAVGVVDIVVGPEVVVVPPGVVELVPVTVGVGLPLEVVEGVGEGVGPGVGVGVGAAVGLGVALGLALLTNTVNRS